MMEDAAMTEDQHATLFKKLTDLLTDIEKVATEGLRDFTVEDLVALQKIYGKTLAYDLYTDVNDALAMPRGSETIH